MVKQVELNSSAINAVAYDTIKHTLIITFKNGVDYTYPDLNESYYTGLITAASAGKYYNQVIKPLISK